MFRFFVNQKEDNYFLLDKETLNHIKVTRVSKEDFICVFNEEFYICSLENERAKIISKLEENHEFKNPVILALALIETKNFELVVQKATELGVTELVPFKSQNVSKKINDDFDKKIARWNIIAKNASEQSFRNKQMIVSPLSTLEEVIKMDTKNKYIAHEKEESDTITSLPSPSLLIVGPEGGFTEQKVQLALKHNCQVISLGKRILRAETAAIVLASKVVE